MMASTNITIPFITVAGRIRYDLDLHYLIMTEAWPDFYSNGLGSGWAIACRLFPCRLLRGDGYANGTWQV